MNRTGLALALALAVSVACADDDNGAGGSADGSDEQDTALMAGPAGWDVIDEPPAEPPTFSARPVWESESPGTATGLIGATLHGDDAVIVAREGSTTRLDVVDLTAGELRWSLASPGRDRIAGEDGELRWLPWSALLDRGRPVVVEGVEPGGGWAVLVHYQEHLQQVDEYRRGVAALSGETGELLWETRIDPGGGQRNEDLVNDMVGIDDTAVMLASPDPSVSWQMTALDPVDGSTLWEWCCIAGSPDPSVSPVAVTGGTVLVHGTTRAGDADAGGSPGGGPPSQTVAALDAATGEPRWHLADRYLRSQIVLTASDLALVEVSTADPGQATGSSELLVLEADSGRELASFGSQASSCTSDRQTVIACMVDDPGSQGEPTARVATLGVEDREAGVSAPVPDLLLLGAQDQYLFAVRPEDDAKLMLDRAGNVLAEGASGPLVAMSDRYAVFADASSQFFPTGTQPYAVFRVG